ncbi:GNAT family N-acetyltransferase [Halobacillus sp. Marseille-Q1614]|uniref:GNAT family N-acetyltransferase n=1 Tax=Halobacillus sp. Marseille-Q1614 TaxID=2709134 RepID=UPI0020C3627B|nr:GNAT family N-acetyltransferase [Halobacillus sp. Marseille-Q1614]
MKPIGYVRTAEIADAKDMARLMSFLGYPAALEEMEDRLPLILNDPIYHTCVYEAKGQLIGMIGMMYSRAYHTDDSHIRVIAFVVHPDYQGNGVGRALMNEAEKWGRDKEATRLTLNSGNRDERKQAHSIYEQLGFEGKATGFYKKL